MESKVEHIKEVPTQTFRMDSQHTSSGPSDGSPPPKPGIGVGYIYDEDHMLSPVAASLLTTVVTILFFICLCKAARVICKTLYQYMQNMVWTSLCFVLATVIVGLLGLFNTYYTGLVDYQINPLPHDTCTILQNCTSAGDNPCEVAQNTKPVVTNWFNWWDSIDKCFDYLIAVKLFCVEVLRKNWEHHLKARLQKIETDPNQCPAKFMFSNNMCILHVFWHFVGQLYATVTSFMEEKNLVKFMCDSVLDTWITMADYPLCYRVHMAQKLVDHISIKWLQRMPDMHELSSTWITTSCTAIVSIIELFDRALTTKLHRHVVASMVMFYYSITLTPVFFAWFGFILTNHEAVIQVTRGLTRTGGPMPELPDPEASEASASTQGKKIKRLKLSR